MSKSSHESKIVSTLNFQNFCSHASKSSGGNKHPPPYKLQQQLHDALMESKLTTRLTTSYLRKPVGDKENSFIHILVVFSIYLLKSTKASNICYN